MANEAQIRDKATKVRLLQNEDTFKDTLKVVRDEQVSVFLSPNSSTEDIKEAHDIICALEKIEGYFKTVLTDEAFLTDK